MSSELMRKITYIQLATGVMFAVNGVLSHASVAALENGASLIQISFLAG